MGAAVFGALALQNFLPPKRPDAAWAKTLSERQRKLFGLSPGFNKNSSALVSSQAQGAVASPFTPLGPPLRGSRAATVVSTPVSDGGNAASNHRTFASAGRSGGRISPYPTRHLSTPVQLQKVMDEFELETKGTDASGTSVSPHENDPISGPGYMRGPYRSPTTSSPADAQRIGTSKGSYLGRAPTYRPSAVPKGAAALPHRPDGPVQASSQESLDVLLKDLDTSQAQLEEYRERFREWLATKVLQPLVDAVDAAHQDVIDATARLGWQGLQLAPLHQVVTGSLPDTEERSAKARGLVQADDEHLVKQMQESLMTRVNALPPSHHAPQEVINCLHALIRYQKLAALLRGESPGGLLPLCPPGYLAQRVRDLADGPCMKTFTWNKGGNFNGKPWNAEAPTDSAVVLYLIAAFLASPHWEFMKDDSVDRGPMGPLYLGKLPLRVAEQYFAILSHRPPNQEKQKGTGVVGLLLGSQQPHFALLLQGETLLTLTEQFGLLDVMILLILHCKHQSRGYLGPQTLHFLGLNNVVRVPSLRLARRVFGLW